MAQTPIKHHYIPVFYAKNWAAKQDGKICAFSRPHEEIIAEIVHPARTGYKSRLYELEGTAPGTEKEIESTFFKNIDTSASNIINYILNNDYSQLSRTQKKAWVKFVFSMMNRAPIDIDRARSAFQKSYIYHVNKSPSTLELEEFMFETYMRSLESSNSQNFILNSEWVTLTIPSDIELLTSDLPVQNLKELLNYGRHLTIPLNPRKLFIASEKKLDIQTVTELKNIAKSNNRAIVKSASYYVYGSSNKLYSFVKRHFNKENYRVSAELANASILSCPSIN